MEKRCDSQQVQGTLLRDGPQHIWRCVPSEGPGIHVGKNADAVTFG